MFHTSLTFMSMWMSCTCHVYVTVYISVCVYLYPHVLGGSSLLDGFNSWFNWGVDIQLVIQPFIIGFWIIEHKNCFITLGWSRTAFNEEGDYVVIRRWGIFIGFGHRNVADKAVTVCEKDIQYVTSNISGTGNELSKIGFKHKVTE